MNDEKSAATEAGFWKRCSICKKEITFGSKYYLCSVSTCRHRRTGLRFCSVPCWDGHLGFARHRESWAEEATAPSREQYLADEPQERSSEETRPTRRQVISPPHASLLSSPATVSATRAPALAAIEADTLVVVSKVKQLVRDQSDYNTSQCFIDELSRKVASECLKGIAGAKAACRKTVMGRDIK